MPLYCIFFIHSILNDGFYEKTRVTQKHACTNNVYLYMDDISKYARTELIEDEFVFVFCECFYGNVAVLDQSEDCL